jgi:hypothetical protein
MFVFDRSAIAVVIPLALLVAVVLWSNRAARHPAPPPNVPPVAASPDARDDQALAANLPSR